MKINQKDKHVIMRGFPGTDLTTLVTRIQLSMKQVSANIALVSKPLIGIPKISLQVSA